MRIAISALTPVEPTAFVTQHARALDSRWPKPTLGPAVDLYPAAARGPKAETGTNIRIPMGEGIVGVAAQEGVAIAVSGNELCSPAQRDGRVYGALQLVNKKGGAFTADEISILDYLASQFAEYVITTGQTEG